MKNKIQFSIITLALIAMLSSCEKDEYACETYFKQYGEYLCTNWAGDKASCEATATSSEVAKYYSGKTCQDIGYTNYSEGGSNIVFESPLGNKYKGSGSTIDITGGGGGGGGSCTSSYNGPSTTTYPQAAPFCYQAWYYRCSAGLSLTSQQVSTNCSTYKIFRDDNPNLPVCNFCQ